MSPLKTTTVNFVSQIEKVKRDLEKEKLQNRRKSSSKSRGKTHKDLKWPKNKKRGAMAVGIKPQKCLTESHEKEKKNSHGKSQRAWQIKRKYLFYFHVRSARWRVFLLQIIFLVCFFFDAIFVFVLNAFKLKTSTLNLNLSFKWCLMLPRFHHPRQFLILFFFFIFFATSFISFLFRSSKFSFNFLTFFFFKLIFLDSLLFFTYLLFHFFFFYLSFCVKSFTFSTEKFISSKLSIFQIVFLLLFCVFVSLFNILFFFYFTSFPFFFFGRKVVSL